MLVVFVLGPQNHLSTGDVSPTRSLLWDLFFKAMAVSASFLPPLCRQVALPRLLAHTRSRISKSTLPFVFRKCLPNRRVQRSLLLQLQRESWKRRPKSSHSLSSHPTKITFYSFRNCSRYMPTTSISLSRNTLASVSKFCWEGRRT